jgi:serine/threonine-protein kinase
MYDANKIVVQSLESGASKELLAGGSPRYLPTGHIVYAEDNNLFAVSFDLNKLEVTSGRVPIVEGIYLSDFSLQYAVSDSGTLAYVPSNAGGLVAARTLVWVDRSGNEEPLGTQPNMYRFPKISPDGTRIAVTVGSGRNADIWIWDMSRKTLSPLTSDKIPDTSPAWSPDGKSIVFASLRESAPGICSKPADGTGTIETLGSTSLSIGSCLSWSGDGKALVFEEMSDGTISRISAISMEGDRAKRQLWREDHILIHPQISPDGRWIAYVSDESGKFEVYVRPYPEVNSGKWTISTGGGSEPRWSPNGRELFYRTGDAMMAAAIETKPVFKAGIPKELFRRSYFAGIGMHWDISPDGKLFLMIKEAGDKTAEVSGPRKMVVVLNWLEELKQRVPVK